jgi:site-specific DNA-methyltransferase (adenine-specific)
LSTLNRSIGRSDRNVQGGEQDPAWGEIVCADNLTLMRELPDACCDLVYADPPFALDRAPSGPAPQAARFSSPGHGDLEGHLAFLEPRLIEMHRLLSARGSLYVHLDWRSVHHVKLMLDTVFGAKCFLNEIIWSYRTGGRPARWFMRKHDTILLYARQPGRHTFNRMRGGAYRTRDLQLTEEGQPYKSTRNGPIYFHAEGPILSDVWDIPFLSTVSKERTNYPTQKPEALLERIIQASSNEGDNVADFFCGSGTTLAVAKRLGRRWIGCDVNPDAVAIAKRRLAKVG